MWIIDYYNSLKLYLVIYKRLVTFMIYRSGLNTDNKIPQDNK
jgi:hypothetical protein